MPPKRQDEASPSNGLPRLRKHVFLLFTIVLGQFQDSWKQDLMETLLSSRRATLRWRTWRQP
eukprot:2333184-Amphidinium_carterae.1